MPDNTCYFVAADFDKGQWQDEVNAMSTDVGIIGGGKKKPTGVVDIATYQSLINKKVNTVSEIVQDYGHVIDDECHHVSAPRFEMVLNVVRAKYVLGLTPPRTTGWATRKSYLWPQG